MFAVMIEAKRREEQWDAYLTKANMLRAELERAPGLVESVRYRSLTRNKWILSVSAWRDEASLVDWHRHMREDEAEWLPMLADYRLRFGEVTSDTRIGDGREFAPKRLAAAGVGEGTYVTLIDAAQTPDWLEATNPQDIALYLGFDLYSYGDCISWDIFDSLSSPGQIILAVTWKDAQSANDHAATQIVPDDARVRVVRILRDETMSALRETARSGPRLTAHEAIRS